MLYADGELGETERIVLEHHLSECAACRSAVNFQVQLKSVVRRRVQQVSPPAPSALRSRLAASLVNEAPVAATPIPRAARWRRLVVPLSLAAGAAVAVGAGAWMFAGARTRTVMRDVVARHARPLPLEIVSNDPVSLERWLSDKVEFKVRVPPTPPAPLNLIGARLSHVGDQDAVYVEYGTPESPSRRVSMVVFGEQGSSLDTAPEPPQRIDLRDVVVSSSAGYNVALWKDHELTYSVVTDTDDDPRPFVQAAAYHAP